MANAPSSGRIRALVALDGSPAAERALRWAENLARVAAVDMVLFRVSLPPRAAVLLAPMAEQENESAGNRRELAEEYLRSLSVELREGGLEATYEARSLESLDETVAEMRAYFTREIGDLILARAGKDDVDLVIMASHGMTNQAAVKWGSVTQYILSNIKKPILMVPAQ